MESTNHIKYEIEKSAERIDNILSSGSGNYEDKEKLPSRNNLSYANGFYVNVSALFIDIVGSSSMTDVHNRPVLAKTYRCFISECTAIINSSILCEEININGDCVWGVFDTASKSDIDHVFNLAAKLNSLITILNYKLRKKGYSSISVGIGIDYGRALMIKAGYSGSGLNDVVWMGDVVNSACHLSGIAGRNGRNTIVVSSCVYSNLNEHNRHLLHMFSSPYESTRLYEGEVINTEMNEWYKSHCM